MSFVPASHSLWNLFVVMLGILLAVLLLVLPVLLLTRTWLWARKSLVFGEIVIKSAVTDTIAPRDMWSMQHYTRCPADAVGF